MQAEFDPVLAYPDVVAEVLRRVGRDLGVEVTDADAAEFGAAVGDWPPFGDSGPALRCLAASYELIIVSNVDRASFARSASQLGVDFDRVITAEDVGSYKPALGHFDELMATTTGSLCHVAQSLFHDIEPATKLGLPTVWIDRRANRGTSGSGATPRCRRGVTDVAVHVDGRLRCRRSRLGEHVFDTVSIRDELRAVRVDRAVGPGALGSFHIVAERYGAAASYRMELASIPDAWPGAHDAASQIARYFAALFDAELVESGLASRRK